MKWIGIREYRNNFGDVSFDKIVIKKSTEQTAYLNQIKYRDIYTVYSYYDIPDKDNEVNDMTRSWTNSLSSAKRLAMQDTGLKNKDFEWTIVE